MSLISFEGVRYLHLVPQLIRDPSRAVPVIDDPFGSDFLDRVAKTARKLQATRLSRINHALQLAVPQLEQLAVERDDVGRPHLQARYRHWRPHGATQDERDFSDGTLRLIGLLWALLETGTSGGVVVLEEPELNLHQSVVEQLPSMRASVQRSGGGQVWLTTHAFDLIADPGVGLDEVLVLQPTDEGTTARVLRDYEGIADLAEQPELSLADIARPLTEPRDMYRFSAAL
jgi:predicted ATPase